MSESVTQARKILLELMQKVPEGVNNGGYQKAVNFKKFYAECSKALASNSKSEALFVSLISRYRSY